MFLKFSEDEKACCVLGSYCKMSDLIENCRTVILQLESPGLVAAVFITGIGGTFQFGFQVSVLTSPSSFIKEFVNSSCVQRYSLPLEQWQVSLIWSFIVSIFCIGGILGSLCAGRLTAVFGRKRCLLFNNLTALSGAVLMLLSRRAMSFEMILVARFLYGISSGVSLCVHTMYIVECAPKELRGMVGVSVVTFMSLGKFSGQLLGISELLGTEDRWPWLLSFSGVTALIQLSTLPLLPESPRYLLLEKGDRQACEKALDRLWGSRDHHVEVQEMQVEHAALKGVRCHTVLELILEQSVRWQFLTVVVVFSTVQFCGINAVYLYSFDVFRSAGIPAHQLRYASLGTGLCELFSSLFCLMILERTGKKLLLFRGYLCMAFTLGLLTITLYLQSQVFWMPYCSMVLIFFFIFFFSSGPAAVTAALPGEVFTQSFKTPGYTIACTINWTGLFLLGMLFPLIVEHMDYFCFLIFLCFCLFSGLFVWYNVPEFKNKTALEIAAEFQRMHPRTESNERITGQQKHKEIQTQFKSTKF
ncbi:solute carrier family 2, facilitated glucose transporter member 11-like [Aplochiton taeniatus]